MNISNFSSVAFLVIMGVLLSCNNAPEPVVKSEVTISKKEILTTDGESKTMASLGIEGMTCSVGCAKKIQKTLAGMEGIISCEVAFEDKLANVQYDDSKISEKDLITTIEGLNSGQYAVTSVEVEKTIATGEPANDVEEDQSSTTDNTGAQVLALPNIFDVLSRIYSY